jgi:putative spermidine/putrescine transport system permease protein
MFCWRSDLSEGDRPMRTDAVDLIMSVAGVILRPLVYIGLALPAAIVVLTSFTAGDRLRFPPEGFSLRWYWAAIESDPFMTALWLSTRLALAAMAISLAIGLAAAFGIDRYRFRGREAFKTFTLSPLVVPMVVLGLGLLQLLSWMGLNQTFIGLLAGHVLITLPYVVRTLTASFVLFDRTLEEAAMNLRAGPLRILRRITLPLLTPALVAAAVFAFVTSFGNITLSIFLGYTGTTTLPVQIFTYVEHSYSPVLASVSTLVILVTLLVISAVERLVGMERITS